MSPAPESARPAAVWIAAGLATLLLSLLIYLPSAGAPPLQDEEARLQKLAGGTPASALAYQEGPDDSRPLANLVRQALVAATGSTSSVRAAAALLHGLNAALLMGLGFVLLRRWNGGEPGLAAPLAGALVFVAHPLASEAILSHASFPIVLGTSFALLSLILASGAGSGERRMFPISALYLAALLCDGALWPVALAGTALLAPSVGEPRPRAGAAGRLSTMAPYLAAATLFYVAWVVRDWPSLHWIRYQPSPGWTWLIASFLSTIPAEIRLLLAPWGGLAVDHGVTAFAGHWGVPTIAGALVLGAAFALPFVWRRQGPARFSLVLFAALHLHFLAAPPMEPLQERRLYPLLLPLGLAAAAVARALERRFAPRATLAGAAIIAAVLGLAALQRTHLWGDPLALWESAAAVSPSSPRARVSVGDVHAARGEEDLALQSYEAALAIAPRSAGIQQSIAEIYFRKGDYLRALQEADKAMQLDPSYFPAYITAGNAFMRREKPRDAFLAFNAALSLRPTDPTALFNMGSLLFDQNRFAQAAELLKRASEARPHDPDILFRLGMSRVNTGDLDGAAESLRGCLAEAPDRLDARINLASVLTQLHHQEEARQLLDAILAADPANAKALNGLAVLESTQGHGEEARRLFERAVEADPADLRALYNLAGAYERLNEKDKAAAAYRKFLERWTGAMDFSEDARARLARLEADASR